MDKAVACLPYVPLPGLGLVAARLRPADRLVRFHARQGGWLVAGTYAFLCLAGAITIALPSAQAAFTVAIVLVTLYALGGLLVGIVGASRGRFARIRGVWDILAR